MTVRSSLPTRERLRSLVGAMAGRPVVVLADLVADRFISGTPKRISREAPVLILAYEGDSLTPGGGANAVANVAALGGRPLPLGIVGDDETGRLLVDELAGRGVDVSGIRRRAGYRTPTKVRILAGARHALKQQVVRYDVEDHLRLGDDDRAAFAERLAAWRRELSAPPRAAILSDYGYGCVEPALAVALRSGFGDGCTVVCDSRYRLADFAACDACDGATPNEEETEALFGRPLDDADGGLDAAGQSLRRRLATRFLLVTRGSRGMSLFDNAGAVHVPVHGTDQVADVTGAGDTVIATFTLALAAGATPLEATLLADYAGGVVVMKMGTATLSAGELAAAIEADPAPLAGLRSSAAEGA